MTELRDTFSFRFKLSVIKKFREHCDKYGYNYSKRLEILMLREVKNPEEV